MRAAVRKMAAAPISFDSFFSKWPGSKLFRPRLVPLFISALGDRDSAKKMKAARSSHPAVFVEGPRSLIVARPNAYVAMNPPITFVMPGTFI